MSEFDAIRRNRRQQGQDAKERVLNRVYSPKSPAVEVESEFAGIRNRPLQPLPELNQFGGVAGRQYGPPYTPKINAHSQVPADKPKSTYEQRQEEIDKLPGGVRQFASAMNWLVAGNPVGNFLSQATNIPGVSVTTPDSTGSKVADTIGTGIGKFVGPVLVPSGAPLGTGPLAAPYAATEKVLATGKGQKAVEAISKAIPKVKPEKAQNIARGALTEGIAGAIQAPAQTLLMDSGASGKELALNAALGAGGGLVLGGAAGSLSGLFKKNGIPKDEVQEILALPESKTQVRMREAAARSKNAYGSDPIANPYTHELPEASPKLKSLVENTKAGRAELSQIDRTLNELESQYEQRVIEEYKFLKESRDSRKGVQQGNLQRNAEGEVIGRTGRMSENPLWYQEFFQKNGRVPSNKDLYQLARERVDNGFQDESGFVPSWRQETGYDEKLTAYAEAKENLQGSLRELDPALKVTDAPLVTQRLKDLRRNEGTKTPYRQPAQVVRPRTSKRLTSVEDIVRNEGFVEVTPETIAKAYNNKAWYHGTGEANLTAESLDPFVGSHESLFGHGVYLTDDPKIAAGYAKNRGRRTSTPTVYEANVNINRVLDIEKKPTPDVADALLKSVKGLDYSYESNYGEPNHFTNLVSDRIQAGDTTEQIITALRKEVAEFSHEAEIPTSEFVEDFQDLAINLKNAGYDALTHTGGHRTGNAAHRVMIMLDPQNVYGSTEGPKQFTQFNKYNPEVPKNEDATWQSASRISHLDTSDIPDFLLRRKSRQASDPPAPEPVNFDPNADSILRLHQFEDNTGLGISAFSRTKPYDSLSNETRSQLVTRLDRDPVSFTGLADRLYTNLVDDLHPLNQFDKLVEEVLDKPLSAAESTHKLALATRGADMTARQIITDKLVDSQGKVVGESLKEILSGLPKTVRGGGVNSTTKSQIRKVSKDIYVDFEDYLINKHAITRAERGETVFSSKLLWTPEYGVKKVAEYEALFPEFRDTAERLYAFNRQLVQSWLVDTGIISPETAQAWFDANPYYVPNKRYFSPLEKRSGGVSRTKKGFGNQSVPVKGYSKTGSERKIISPIEAIIENVDAYVKTAKRNQVMQQTVKHIRQDPQAFEDYFELVMKPKGNEDLLHALLSGDGVDDLVSSLDNDFAKIKRTPLDKDNIVRTLIKGEPVYVKVNDPQLLEAITALGPKASNMVMDAVGWLTNKMKTLTTGANPVFSLTRNILRDIPHAYIASKTTNNPVRFLVDLADASIQILRDGELYKQYKRIGGGHSSSIAANRNLLAQSKRSVLPKSLMRDLGPRFFHALENAMNAVETAPRLAEFKRASMNGDLKSALFEAQDLTVNFKRRGKLIAELDKVFPYMNAAIQGLDQFVRLYKNNPRRATIKAFLALTVPGAVMYAVNHDDPNYQKVSNRVKDNFLLIPKGDGTFWKIAKPKELGTLFIDLPERLMRKFAEDDPAAFRDFADQLRTNFLPPGISGAAKSGGFTDRMLGAIGDTIIGPFADLAANQTFSGSPIVPGYLERKSPGLQADTKTTSIARWIGDKTYGTKFEQSPMKLDYLAKQYTGFLGQFGQPLLSPGGDVGSALSQQVTADPVFSNDLSTEFYNYKGSLDQAFNDRELKDLPDWYNDPLRKRLNKISDNMSKVRKEIRAVQADKEMSKADKREKLRTLQDKINTLAEQGIQLARGKVPYK